MHVTKASKGSAVDYALGAMRFASCETALDEYWMHVAAQEEMPLAGAAKIQSTLEKIETLFPSSSAYEPGSITEIQIAEMLLRDASVANELRMLASISDKRFYLDLSYRFSRELIHPDAPATICGCLPHTMRRHGTATLLNYISRGTPERRKRAAGVTARYLSAKGVLTVLDLYLSLDANTREAVRIKWLYPKEAQQNETKRRGHGAEAEVARVLAEAGIAIIPENKAQNPMGAHDPNVSLENFEISPRDSRTTISVDIAAADPNNRLQIIVFALVQSSDPGQFGVNKAETNRTNRERLDQFRSNTGSQLEMWGVVDGIGYSENVNGTLAPMLGAFHQFVQHKSSFKALLGAHRLGLCEVVGVRYDSDFYTEQTSTSMHSKYGSDVPVHVSTRPNVFDREIVAGKARVWVRT
jgi:hypothetical protein